MLLHKSHNGVMKKEFDESMSNSLINDVVPAGLTLWGVFFGGGAVTLKTIKELRLLLWSPLFINNNMKLSIKN